MDTMGKMGCLSTETGFLVDRMGKMECLSTEMRFLVDTMGKKWVSVHRNGGFGGRKLIV